jgi:hypothetical protein
MAEMTSGTALRQIQAAQSGLKRARKAMLLARQTPDRDGLRHVAVREGWDALTRAHRELSAIPLSAANDVVLVKQIALQRYSTSMLVRLRRLMRNESIDEGEDEDADDAE